MIHIQDEKLGFLFSGFLRPFGATTQVSLYDGSFSVFCHPGERSDVGIQWNKIHILNLILYIHNACSARSGVGIQFKKTRILNFMRNVVS